MENLVIFSWQLLHVSGLGLCKDSGSAEAFGQITRFDHVRPIKLRS